MEKDELKRLITYDIVKCLADQGRYFVPAAASNRHVHLSQEDVERLFGSGYKLKEMRPLSQPGQYACEEKLTLVGSKGKIEGIRILGPVRPETQVEVSLTDTFALGIAPAVRMSGDLKETPTGKLIGPAGEVALSQGVIVSARHLHMSDEEAAWYGVKSGDVVSVRKTGDRAATFGNVRVRAGKAHALELHIDTDEANAAAIKNGDLLELLK
jgi:putative phosphotransacetylase